MNFIDRLLSPLGSQAETTPTYINDRIWQGAYPHAMSGVSVTPDSAMRLSAVWACVRLVSNSLASIPLITYRRRADGGRDRARQMPLYDLLHDRPNRYMTAFSFKRLMMVHVLLRGNGYAYIQSGPRGPIDHLDPIHPDSVENVVLLSDDQLAYDIRQPDGKLKRFLDDEIFHLCGLSFDGITGVSVVEYAREAMGLAMATESYGARHFSQNAVPAAVLIHPARPNAEARKRIRAEWEADVSGLDNAHKTAVLAEGIKVEKLSMSNDDSQFLQTREFQIADIARWFGVPLHMIQEVSGSTSWGSGLEQMSQGFVTFTLLPWAMLWEQTISRDLIMAEQAYFAEFLFDALVRADFKTRYETYDIALKDNIMSRNEVRQRENLNPVVGGDWADRAKQITPPSPQPPPRPPAPEQPEQPEEEEGHYRRLLRENAGRVIRKELAALRKAAARCHGDAVLWAEHVKDFYADHAPYVAETMCIGENLAGAYVATQEDTITRLGPDGFEAWLIGQADALVLRVQNQESMEE